MTAQTIRLNTVASNLANAHTAGADEASTYHARKPVFAAILQAAGEHAAAGASVRVLDVVQSTDPLRKVHEPGNPLADENGNVLYPNVNPVEEMTDMMSASRAFATDVEVLARANSMQQELLKLGQSL